MTLGDLRELGFPHLVTKSKLAELLQEKYPEQDFGKVFRLNGRYSQQKRLERILRFSLFPVPLIFGIFLPYQSI